MTPLRCYKLLTLRKDKSLGPLFINRRQRISLGVWMKAEPHRTKGYAFRPGWHACAEPKAPHLTNRGRVWCRCSIKQYKTLVRPVQQGGVWYLAKWIRVDEVLA